MAKYIYISSEYYNQLPLMRNKIMKQINSLTDPETIKAHVKLIEGINAELEEINRLKSEHKLFIGKINTSHDKIESTNFLTIIKT